MRSRIGIAFFLGLAATWSLPPSRSLAQSVPDSIEADNVPVLPKDVVEMLAPYQHVRTASFQDWASTGRDMLILTRFAQTAQVHRLKRPEGARRQLTFLPDRVLGVLPRPGLDEFLAVTDEGGAENYQFLLYRDGRPRRLTDGKSRHVGPRWSPSGKLLAYGVNSRNGVDMDLWVMNPDVPDSARMLKEVAGSWSVSDWSPDEKKLVAVQYVSINESYVHEIDVSTGESVALTPRPESGKETVSYSDVSWAKDGKSLFWTSDKGSEFRRLRRFDLASKTETVLTEGIPWDVESYDLADDGKTLILLANEDGSSRLHVFDVESGREKPSPKLPAGEIGGLEFRDGSLEFGFTLNGAKSPSDAYSCDLSSGEIARWTESETGGLDPSAFVEPSLIRYPTFDGREIPAFVYRPSSEKFSRPRPALVIIHGGPEGQTRPGYIGSLNALVNELGIAVIQPNVRGSSGYGKTYVNLDNGRLREDSVKDIGALLDWIAKQPDLDKDRVAVYGGSYGGYMVLASMTHYNDRLRAGIDVVGISNWVTFLKNTQGYRRDLRRAEYGDERDPEMAAFLERISPLNKADKITKPLLVVQGRNDPRVPASESRQMVERVRRNGGSVWYVTGKNEGHGFAKKANQDYQQAAQVVFLRTYLLGD